MGTSREDTADCHGGGEGDTRCLEGQDTGSEETAS